MDFNKITINDEHDRFKETFVTGPGFQVAQIFVESIFDNHVNWIELLRTDDNYKNRLQVVLQKAFKVTPVYIELGEWDEDQGYHMGVYLCIGQLHHSLCHEDANSYDDFGSLENQIMYYLL